VAELYSAEKEHTMPPVTNSEFAVAAKGTYLTQLCDIEAKTAPQKNDRGETRDSTFWVWKFRGFLTKDKLRKMVPVEITTGTGLSSKASALKNLLMLAYPDKSLDELKTFNTDEMIGKAWVVKVGEDEKPNGGKKNIILNIEPSDDDPFADTASDDDEDDD